MSLLADMSDCKSVNVKMQERVSFEEGIPQVALKKRQ